MMRQAKLPTDIRTEAYRFALECARAREKDGDPEGAGVIRDLAASIKGIRLTRDVVDGHKPLVVGDLDLSVRLVNTLGAASPAALVGDVLDNGAHPLRSKLRVRDLKQLPQARHEAGVV